MAKNQRILSKVRTENVKKKDRAVQTSSKFQTEPNSSILSLTIVKENKKVGKLES